jgi:hypothetical protein
LYSYIVQNKKVRYSIYMARSMPRPLGSGARKGGEMETSELVKAIEGLGCHVREFKEDVYEFEGKNVLTGDILLKISPAKEKEASQKRP